MHISVLYLLLTWAIKTSDIHSQGMLGNFDFVLSDAQCTKKGIHDPFPVDRNYLRKRRWRNKKWTLFNINNTYLLYGGCLWLDTRWLFWGRSESILKVRHISPLILLKGFSRLSLCGWACEWNTPITQSRKNTSSFCLKFFR